MKALRIGLIALGMAAGGGGVSQAVTAYTNDAQTVRLEHFDALLTNWPLGSLLGYFAGKDCSPDGVVAPNQVFGGVTMAPNCVAGLGPGYLQLVENALNIPPVGAAVVLLDQGLPVASGTVECWMNLRSIDSTSGPHGLIRQSPTLLDCTNATFTLSLETNQTLRVVVPGAFTLDSTPAKFPTNGWAHVAVTWGAAGARLYVDGALVASHSATQGVPPPNLGTNLFLWPAHGVDHFGWVDELRISDVQRTLFQSSPAVVSTNLQIYAGFTLSGPAGASCRVEYAPQVGDTNHWLTLTNLVLPEGPFLFVDPTAALQPARYYRAIITAPY